MNKEEVKHLATLARLKLTEEEIEKYAKDLGGILDYIEKIKEVSDVGEDFKIENASIRNVMREDIEPILPGTYTDDLLKEAPEIKDGYVKVKKIL